MITFTLPHYLGSANLGRYAFAVAVFGMTEIGADLGIGTYLNRQRVFFFVPFTDAQTVSWSSPIVTSRLLAKVTRPARTLAGNFWPAVRSQLLGKPKQENADER